MKAQLDLVGASNKGIELGIKGINLYENLLDYIICDPITNCG